MTTVDIECPPAHHVVPEHVGTYGPEVADLAATVGFDLDPEQRLLINAMYAYDNKGRLVSTEVGCAAPRQNLKSHCGKAASLADLVLFAEPQGLWTAHLRKTSDEMFRNSEGTGLADLFDSYDFLRRLVDTITDSDGEKSIVLRAKKAGLPKPTLDFVTRSVKGGRGLTGRRVTFDEALFLAPAMTSAMVPILSARSMSGQVQVRYLGSPGLPSSQVWRDVRDRGRSGASPALAWLEWAADRRPCTTEKCPHTVGVAGCVLDDPELIRAANLAVGRRIDIRFVLQTERHGMSPEDYMRERMGWWQDPPNLTGGDLDVEQWSRLVDEHAQPASPLAFGVDQSEDRTVSIACCWRRSDGHVQLMLSQGEQVDTDLSPAQGIARLTELAVKWNAPVMLGGPAADFERDLTAVGASVAVVTAGEFATSCGHLDDRIREGSLRHGGQPALSESIGVARWRSVGTAGERAFQLKDAPGIGPAAAAVRALHGVLDPPSTGGWMFSL